MNYDSCYYEIDKPKKEKEYMTMQVSILFVLDGSITVNVLEDVIKLKKGDALLINPGIKYSYKNVEDALIASAMYSMKMINTVMKGKSVIFYCNSVEDHSRSYEDIRNIFYQLTAEYLREDRKSDCKLDSTLYLLLDALIEKYQTENLNEAQGSAENDIRMQQMMQYIIANLTEEINLTDLADSMYVSTSTLSRIFKKNTGVYFADYVTRLRLQPSLRLLTSTNQSMTQIALSCGFTNSASFNRAFRKEMNMSPSKYREIYKKENGMEEEKENEHNIIRERLKKSKFMEEANKTSSVITVDLEEASDKCYEKFWSKMINAGSVMDLTRANMQYHIQYLQEHFRFEYMRIWSLFSSDLMITDGSGKKQCNFDLVDITLDFFVKNRIKVFLDLGRRPEQATHSMGNIYYRDNYIKFESRRAWEKAFTEFVNHILDRYGLKEVSGWSFELTQIPFVEEKDVMLYYGDEYNLEEAYYFLYKIIKEKIPGALFGGFGKTVEGDWKELSGIYSRISANNMKPDFVSFLLFPYEEVNVKSGKQLRRVARDPDNEMLQIRQMRRMMKSCGLSNSKLYITEWNESISNRNYINDSCFRGCYFAATIEKILGQVDMLSIMCSSDWISNYLDTEGLLNGGIGLLSKDGIRKPAYFALDFLNTMGERILSHNRNYIMTETGEGGAKILLFNYSWFGAEYFLCEEDVSLKRMDNKLFLEEEELDIAITIKNLQRDGDWYIKRRILNKEYGSILDAWEKFQYETRLTRADVKYLESVSVPKLSLEKIRLKDRSLTVKATLSPQELCLIHIFPMD